MANTVLEIDRPVLYGSVLGDVEPSTGWSPTYVPQDLTDDNGEPLTDDNGIQITT